MIIVWRDSRPYLALQMKYILAHIARSYATTLVVALLLLSTTAFAENDKRAGGGKASSTKASAASLSPVTRAVASGLKALTVRKYASDERAQTKTNTGRDSAIAPPRIVSTRVSAEVFSARVELAGDESLVDIAIYNMLGKRVMDVFKGASARGLHEHTQSISELPEGVYMCVMQGSNFRKAEKFFFNR
ncbi:MAG: T9SS type A sorting domain-containing protein [Candidatus Kapabacteria bacterium]|nr:T9SS type A sorting domain-containing protein [Candidatus Kapabacteria bacterium]